MVYVPHVSPATEGLIQALPATADWQSSKGWEGKRAGKQKGGAAKGAVGRELQSADC